MIKNNEHTEHRPMDKPIIWSFNFHNKTRGKDSRDKTEMMILLQPNTKRREPGGKCHTITMMHRKPVKLNITLN